jgi:hypothetical protein
MAADQSTVDPDQRGVIDCSEMQQQTLVRFERGDRDSTAVPAP